MARWQVLAGPAVGPPAADLTKASGRKVIWRLALPSTLNFTLPGRHPQAGHILELATDVHLLRDGTPLYTGRVGGSGDDITDDQHTITVPTADTRALLARRLTTDPTTTYTGDTGALARALLATAQTGLNADLAITTAAVLNTGATITREIAGGSPISAELDAAAAFGRPATGFDWDITPGWTDRALMVWSPRRGADRGVVLDYTYTGRPRSSIVAKITRQVDPADYANSVRFVGGERIEKRMIQLTDGAGLVTTEEIEVRHPTTPVTVSVAAGAAEGRWESRISDPELVWQAEVAARADAELARLQALQPSYTVALKQGAWDGPDHIWLGDTVRVILRSARLDEDLQLRVTGLDLTLGDSGEEDVALTVGPPRATLLRQIHAMQRRARMTTAV